MTQTGGWRVTPFVSWKMSVFCDRGNSLFSREAPFTSSGGSSSVSFMKGESRPAPPPAHVWREAFFCHICSCCGFCGFSKRAEMFSHPAFLFF